MNDACDPTSLFTSILKDIRQQTISKISPLLKRFKKHVKMQSKSEMGPSRGSNINEQRVTWMPIALLE